MQIKEIITEASGQSTNLESFFDYLHKKYGRDILVGLADIADSGIDYEAFTDEEKAEARQEILSDYQRMLGRPKARKALAASMGVNDNQLEDRLRVDPEACVEAMLDILGLDNITDYYHQELGTPKYQEAMQEIEDSGLIDVNAGNPYEQWHELSYELLDKIKFA